MKLIRLSGFFAGLLLLAPQTWAQFTLRGGVNGVITDSSNAVVPKATVTITDLDQKQSDKTTTNESGLYSFTNLVAGRYQVTVELSGFRKAVSDPIELGGQQNLRVDISLQVGQMAETIEVKSEAPLIRSEQAVLGQTVNQAMVEALPMKGRNFTAMAVLSPNISTTPRGNSASTWAAGGHALIAGVDYRVGGGGDNGYYMNGVNINENWVGGASYAPSSDAISEVRLNVADFSASNGRDISTLQVATRGGASQFHGAGFDYFQNNALNSWNPISKSRMSPGQKMNVLQRNQFGGNLGGPVIIPKVLKRRDKAFFFFNYERMEQRSGGASSYSRVPTNAERQGDFGALLTRFNNDPNYILYNPFSTTYDADGNSSRTVVPRNDLRTIAPLNAQALDLLNIWPKPNGYQDPSNIYNLANYQTTSSSSPWSYRIDARADYRFTDNDNVYVNISRSSSQENNKGGALPEFNGDVSDRSWLVTLNYARVFTPNLTNEAVFGAGKGTMLTVPPATLAYLHQTDTLRNKYFKNIGQGEDLGVYAMNISGIGTAGFGEIFMASNPTVQASDNVSWNRGIHQIKFGGNFFRKQEHDWDYIRGVDFDSTFTRAGTLDSSLGGQGLASFLLGLPTNISQRFNFTGGSPDLFFTMPYVGFFAEDKIQVSSKLTLNVGLRYELPIRIYSPTAYGNATMDFGYPGWQLAIPGRASGYPLHYTPVNKRSFAPRLGIAYRFKSDLVARVSYGIFYNASTSTGIGDTGPNYGAAFGGVPGYSTDDYNSARYNIPDDTPTLKFSDIFPTPKNLEIGQYPVSTGKGTGYFEGRSSVQFFDKKSNQNPYYQRYMAEIQKGIGTAMALTLNYAGGRGVKLLNYDPLNLPAYKTGWASNSVYDNARPMNIGARWGDVGVMRNGLNSYYNAGTIKLERRMSRGLQFVTHYTFSKTVMDSNSWPWHRRLSRGEASFSHPHRFVAALVYQTDFGKSLHPIARALVWGWQIGSITTFESGNSLTIGNSLTSARDREPNRPYRLGNGNLPGSEQTFFRYFDTSAFSAPPRDVKGDSGQGIIRGPGQNNWDLSLGKIFRPVERFRVEFRAELFNAFNHPQWSGVNTSYTNAVGNTFGRVTGAREPRITQLSLKLAF